MAAVHLFERMFWTGLEADLATTTARDGSFFWCTDTKSLWMMQGGGWNPVGGPGAVAYGSCWGNEIAFAANTAVQNTWYAINDTDMTDGQLQRVTHDGSGKLTVSEAGVYHVDYSLSWEVSLANKHCQSGILVSGSAQNDGIAHWESLTANAQFGTSSVAILSLAASAYVQVGIRTTDTGTPNLLVDHCNLTVHRLI